MKRKEMDRNGMEGTVMINGWRLPGIELLRRILGGVYRKEGTGEEKKLWS